MTRKQIEQMPAGLEMDWLIATEIFKALKPTPEQVEMIRIISIHFGHGNPQDKWHETVLIRDLPEKNYFGVSFEFVQPQRYSTDIAAAWLVVEKLIECKVYLARGNPAERAVGWICTLDGSSNNVSARADTVSLAVCRAALIATLENKQ